MAVAALVGPQRCAYPSTCDPKIGALRVHTSVHHTALPFLKMNPQKKLDNNNAILKKRVISTNATAGGNDSPNDDTEESNQPPNGKNSGNDEIDKFRKDLERIVADDDSTFSGVELANLIRNKYGRSYDVTLIKKEFMGRNLLALNVMWKYREQRSFPLTEEEYLLRLDDVANNLKCWGAVSHVRNSLARLKERPRIGKAVSIFIDVDETGGRASEWIYR